MSDEVKETLDRGKELHRNIKMRRAWLTNHAEKLREAARQIDSALRYQEYESNATRYESCEEMRKSLEDLVAEINELDAIKAELGVAEFRS